MKLFIDNFRVWWHKPADPTQRNIHREISMLELFYDLVYVAMIIQLTHLVAGHVTLSSVETYLLVFLMMIWAWFNGSLYHELHGNLDLKTRVVVFLQMLCLVGMGIFIHNAFGEGYKVFALFYGLFSSILCILWWRTGIHDFEQKTVIRPFVRIFILIVFSFFGSIFMPIGVAHIIWIISVSIAMIYTIIFMMSSNEKVHFEKLEATRNIGESFVERLSLITTIILGEGIISLVGGGSHIHHWNITQVLDITGCFILLVLIWGLYFDFISRRLPKNSNVLKGLWLGLHFPMLASIGLINAGILNLLESAPLFNLSDKLIILIPLIVFLLCCLGLMGTIQIDQKLYQIFQNTYKKIWLIILGLVIMAFLPLNKIIILWSSIVFLSVLFTSSLIMWIKLKLENVDDKK